MRRIYGNLADCGGQIGVDRQDGRDIIWKDRIQIEAGLDEGGRVALLPEGGGGTKLQASTNGGAEGSRGVLKEIARRKRSHTGVGWPQNGHITAWRCSGSLVVENQLCIQA